MPELFVELLSEEIPARMQARAAADLARLLGESLAALTPSDVRTWYGPRRIAVAAEVAAHVAAASTRERGPRISAPEQALAGFLRKHDARREDLTQEGDFWLLEKRTEIQPATRLVAAALPALLRRFPWPKSMRWGTGGFLWVRPLRRIVCLLDRAVIDVELGADAHGLTAGDQTEGHRILSPGAITVRSAIDWVEKLRDAHVVADAEVRKTGIVTAVGALAEAEGLSVVDDPGLVDEVAGLVEWPVAHLGRIDDGFMDLPPEVMQVSMRVNQRYFALRHADGRAAARFAFVANIEGDSAAIIAGNERVLRARFSDARHFWDLDRRGRLADRVPALDGVTFHAKLGSQGDRVRRLVRIAAAIAPLVGADPVLAGRAALLAKADLTTGMVGEFPELQGVMGAYYAAHDGEPDAVAAAIRGHYAPRGPGDQVPSEAVGIAVALADKIDQLAGFFSIGEKPTGSGDPYALRRAALGIIRIIVENRLRAGIGALFAPAIGLFPDAPESGVFLDFLVERLRVQLRAEGASHDVLQAVFANSVADDLVALLARTDAVSGFLASEAGRDLLAGYRRAANILRIEEKRDGPFNGTPDPALFVQPQENNLADAVTSASEAIRVNLGLENFQASMAALATLRAPLDAFFESVTVNASEPATRRNRLLLLRSVRDTMHLVADFSKIEG
jgi:glycyl-tRNA synthetase beta chain